MLNGLLSGYASFFLPRTKLGIVEVVLLFKKRKKGAAGAEIIWQNQNQAYYPSSNNLAELVLFRINKKKSRLKSALYVELSLDSEGRSMWSTGRFLLGISLKI